MPEPKAKLVHEWIYDEVRYRLIEKASRLWTYRDVLIVQKCETGELGEDVWVEHAKWKRHDGRDEEAMPSMTSALEQLKAEVAKLTRERDQAFKERDAERTPIEPIQFGRL